LTGDAPNALECFRKALYLEPHNSDVLINAARLLYKLKLYDDAIYLTQKSLEYVRQDRLVNLNVVINIVNKVQLKH
jgi:tetratricopeptide (TPR) repeat protein